MKEALIRINKEGRWFIQGEEITHRRTYLLYNKNLAYDEFGRLILRIGQETCPVEAEDAPFVVKTLEFVTSEQGRLESVWLILNDESREQLIPETLRIRADHIPYCLVRGGMFEARFSRGAYQLLAHFIQHDEKGSRFSLTMNGKAYILTTPPPYPDY